MHSFWGKLAQKVNMSKTELVTEYDRYFEIFANDLYDVKSEFMVDDDTALIQFAFADDKDAPNKTQSLAVSSFVTCWARMKLFTLLNSLHTRKPGCVLYFDTGKIISY